VLREAGHRKALGPLIAKKLGQPHSKKSEMDGAYSCASLAHRNGTGNQKAPAKEVGSSNEWRFLCKDHPDCKSWKVRARTNVAWIEGGSKASGRKLAQDLKFAISVLAGRTPKDR